MLKSKKWLWVIITMYIAIIYLSLSSARSFLTFLQNSFGVEAVRFGINSLLVLSVLTFFTYIALSINDYHGKNRVVSVMIVLLLGGMMAMNIDIPEERIHFLEYGILGYLVLKATIDSWRFSVIYSFFLVSIIGAGDETIQWFLPNRVGDISDVFKNSFGGLLGISIKRLKNGKG